MESGGNRWNFLRAVLWLPAVLAAQPEPERTVWTRLADLPDAIGFAGPFAGVSGGALILAGGANFPDRKPWEGGTKVWHDRIFVLDRPAGSWREAGRLGAPLGYGVSLPFGDDVLCAGGSDAERHEDDVFLLRWNGSEVRQVAHSRLPAPMANGCGAVVGEVIYLAGGITRPDATEASGAFWMWDGESPDPVWRILPGWPGPPRMLAVGGASGGAFYLFGGACLRAGKDGEAVREWLRDAYRYHPDEGWRRIADLPRVVVAAPTPAPELDGRLFVIGGDDGSRANDPPEAHPGFSRSVLAYDPETDRWETSGEAPFFLVTTPLVRWDGRIVVPGGEIRPGVRSTEVWSREP